MLEKAESPKTEKEKPLDTAPSVIAPPEVAKIQDQVLEAKHEGDRTPSIPDFTRSSDEEEEEEENMIFTEDYLQDRKNRHALWKAKCHCQSWRIP